jgi:hypothetical protein
MTSTAAYKFLASGAVGPFSGCAWPRPRDGAPGDWIDIEGALSACTRGVHVCRAPDLAYWLHDELWELEIRGEQLEALDCIVVRHARLVRRIDAWSEGGAARFAGACLARATELIGASDDAAVRGFLEDAATAAEGGYPAISAFSSALAVARSGTRSGGAADPAFRSERAWQSKWIARELIEASR